MFASNFVSILEACVSMCSHDQDMCLVRVRWDIYTVLFAAGMCKKPDCACMGLLPQVSEAEEEEQMQVDNIKQQETQLATAKKAAGLARWRRLQVSGCTHMLLSVPCFPSFCLCL